jgi:sigma-B regulation protein RsbU (phosphoserine phosphatase)
MKPTHGSKTAIADLLALAGVRDAFLENLRGAVGDLAAGSHTAVAFVSPLGTERVAPHGACPCSRAGGGSIACLSGSPVEGRRCQTLPLAYDDHPAGKLVICSGALTPPAVVPAVSRLAVATLRQVELEAGNESLRAQHNARLETAAHIQRTLLLGRPTIDLKSQLRADAVSVPSLEVGGDFYDFYPYDQILDVVVGDVMGKGVQAALLGAATKNYLLRAANYLLASNPARLPEPKEILAIVNAEVFRHLSGIDSFVTLCYARFDLRERRVQIIDCGHTKAVHVRGEEGQRTLLQGENMPIGFSRSDVYKEFTVPFDSGDVFVFSSDGITEARKGGADFGETRLADLVCSLRKLDPRELVDRVVAEVVAYSGTRPPQDDLTCVAVKIEDLNRSIRSKRAAIELCSDLRQIPRAQTFLQEVCRQSLDQTAVAADLAQLQQAVAEVLMNVVLHAYCGQMDKTIRLEASLFVNRLSVRIYHRGEPFDLEPAAPGAGGAKDAELHTVRQRVDKVKCSRGAHGEHEVFLEKTLKH